MTVAQQRKLQRALHLTTGALLLFYVYVPVSEGLQDLVRFLAFPVLVLTGLAMWQAPRIRRMRKRMQPDRSALLR